MIIIKSSQGNDVMFERVLDFIAASWTILRPMLVVSDYEGGVVLRFGRYSREITPGLNWKLSLADNAIITSTVITTMALRPQTLTTKDDLTIVLSAIVKYPPDRMREIIWLANHYRRCYLQAQESSRFYL